VADKLEVLPGPGMVARFGEIVVWAGPQGTAPLHNHLVAEAQRASQGPGGGDQLANSLIAILQRGDPEPQAPFAVVGPGANGITLFLHGPVQAWDSGRWLYPQPVPGWMVLPIGRPWPLIVLAYGAPPPPPSQQGNPFDLMSGVVPGSGFILLRPGGATSTPVGAVPTQAAQPAQAGGGQIAQPIPATPTAMVPISQPVQVAQPVQIAQPAPSPAAPPGQAAAPAGDGGAIDLRGLSTATSAPLRLASDAATTFPLPGQPDVPGVRCEQGHFNHPRATRCFRCGRPISPGTPQLSGPQPCLGVLLADDGSVWALDRGCFVGAQPEVAPEVQSGMVRGIAMRAGPGHTMAPVQVEVQLRGWEARLVDRGAEGGTWIQPPGVESWGQLARYEQRNLPSGSHLSCGGRVLTYLSAWPA
jgi:hypothetical protein